MNNLILTFIGVLIVTSIVLFAFYYRDVVKIDGGRLEYSCEPLDLLISDINSTSFRIQWKTTDECFGLVKYGNSVSAMNLMALNEERNITKYHSVHLKNLEPASTYYLIIFSDETNYGHEGSPIVVTTRSF